MRSGHEQSTGIPIHLYGHAPVGGSRADKHTSQRSTPYNHTTGLRPAPQNPTNCVFDLLLAAGGHRPPSRASSPVAATQRARAGRAPAGHRSRTGSWPFLHSPNATPPLEPAGAWTRAPTASTVPSGARCSYFLVEKAAYRGRESVTTRCTIWRKSRHRLRTPAAQRHRGQ